MGHRIILALSLTAALSSSECTAIGFAVGNTLDARAQNRRQPGGVEDEKIARIPTGTPVMVVLDTGERINGRFAGATSASPSPEYAALYTEAQRRLSDRPLPIFGEPVIVSIDTSRAITGVFQGFYADSVLVRAEGQSQARPYLLRDAASLSREGGQLLSGKEAQRLITERRLPVLTHLMIGKRLVPFHHMRTVAVRPRRPWGRLIGTALGAVLDTAAWQWISRWKIEGGLLLNPASGN